MLLKKFLILIMLKRQSIIKGFESLMIKNAHILKINVIKQICFNY